MKYLPAPIDPYILSVEGQNDYLYGLSYRQVLNRSLRSNTINPNFKTLVLLVTGQSLWSDILPTLYVPVNFTTVDNFNIYDGALYDCNGALLGCTRNQTVGGPGNVAARVADKLVSNSKFNRVIIVSLAIGSTTIANWATGELSNRCSVAFARLASKGITPTTPGVTFACIMGVGEQDLVNGTSEASYRASGLTFISNLQNLGFNGRIFWDQESDVGQTSNAIRSAQASLWNGVNVFNGGDLDSIPPSGRLNGVHFNDLGGIQAQNIVITAMAASGSPF